MLYQNWPFLCDRFVLFQTTICKSSFILLLSTPPLIDAVINQCYYDKTLYPTEIQLESIIFTSPFRDPNLMLTGFRDITV